MKTIYLIMTNCRLEFKNGFSRWDDHPLPLYAYTTLKKARKEIEKLKENEVNDYKEWLSKQQQQRCFTHHQFSVREIIIYNKVLPF